MVGRMACALVVASGMVSAATADSGRVWVFFADKGHATAEGQARAIEGLGRESDPKTVERRRLRRTEAGLFDARDLPVSAGYESELSRIGARVKHRSRWLNAVSVEAMDAATRDAVRGLPFVTGMEPVRQGRGQLPEEAPRAATAGEFSGREFYGASRAQLDQIGVTAVHAAGGTGAGVVIGILDTGFVTTHRAFNEPGRPLRVRASYDFLNNDTVVGIEAGDHPDQHRHGTWILGCIGAYWPDVLVGGAYDAEFVLCKTEDYANEVISEEDNYVAGLEFVEAHGADVCTSSLGYIDWYQASQLDGQTAITTRAVNIATANGLICVTAAGNNGHDENPATNHLLAPADAVQVISCGAADVQGTIAGFSSDGPSADGRIKPEVLACGVNTQTVSSRSDENLGQVSGTSLSTPLVAAAVASLVSKMPCVTVDAMRTLLMGTASRSANPDPAFIEGFGFVNASAALARGTCIADFNGDGFADGFDYDAYVGCFEGEACPACRTPDIDGDGFTDGFDYDRFVAAFEAGC